MRITPKAFFQRVRIHLQRYRLVAAPLQKAADIELAETRNAKLPILLGVNEFVEQEAIGKRLMRYHNIAECNGRHPRLIRQVLEAQPLQERIELRVRETLSLQNQEARTLQNCWSEKSAHHSLLLSRYWGGGSFDILFAMIPDELGKEP